MQPAQRPKPPEPERDEYKGLVRKREADLRRRETAEETLKRVGSPLPEDDEPHLPTTPDHTGTGSPFDELRRQARDVASKLQQLQNTRDPARVPGPSRKHMQREETVKKRVGYSVATWKTVCEVCDEAQDHVRARAERDREPSHEVSYTFNRLVDITVAGEGKCVVWTASDDREPGAAPSWESADNTPSGVTTYYVNTMQRGPPVEIPFLNAYTRGKGFGGGALSSAYYPPATDGILACRENGDVLWLRLEYGKLRETQLVRKGGMQCEVSEAAIAEGGRIVAVMTSVASGSPVSSLSTFSLDSPEIKVLARAQGEVYGWPAISPDGRYCSWVSWGDESSPYVSSRLNVGVLRRDGALERSWEVDGGPCSSCLNPVFLRTTLVYLSNRSSSDHSIIVAHPDSNYASEANQPCCIGRVRPIAEAGQKVISSLAGDKVVAVLCRRDIDVLGIYDTTTGGLEATARLAEEGFTRLWNVVGVDTHRVALFAAGVDRPPCPIVYDFTHKTLRILRGDGPVTVPATSYKVVPFPDAVGVPVAYLFLPPEGVVPCVSGYCAEGPRRGEYPLVVEPHTGWGGGAGWQPDVWDVETQMLTNAGYAVLHVAVSCSIGYQRTGQGRWLRDAPHEITEAVLLAGKHAPIDFHHIAYRAKSIDGLAALHAACLSRSLALAVVLYAFTPSPSKLHASGGGWISNLLEQGEMAEAARPHSLRCSLLFCHSVSDPIVPVSHVEAYVDSLLGDTNYHGKVRLWKVPGEHHPPSGRVCVAEEINFLNTILWDPMD